MIEILELMMTKILQQIKIERMELMMVEGVEPRMICRKTGAAYNDRQTGAKDKRKTKAKAYRTTGAEDY